MLRDVQARGFRQRVFDVGSGPPLLLVHGFPLNHTMWREQLAPLACEHRVIAPDLRGFGGSEVTSEPVSMASLADDLAGLLDALGVGEPVAVCGLSMGGYITWQFWRRHKARVEALILCDTRSAADTPEVARGRRQAAATVLREGQGTLTESMIPKLFAERTRAERPDMIAACRAMIEATDPRTIAGALHAMAERGDSGDLLEGVDVPTLVICGAEDGITPAAEMRAMAERISHARYVEVAGAGHMTPWERPTEFNAAVLEFLAS